MDREVGSVDCYYDDVSEILPPPAINSATASLAAFFVAKDSPT